MIGRRTFLVGISISSLPIVTGCAELFPETYHFRMTVEVETPEGARSGSSVYKVWANNKTPLLPEESKREWGVNGDAVAVDLPGGRTLFALLKTGAAHGDLAGLSMAALDPAFRNDIVESARRISSGRGVLQKAVVRPEDYPMLVMFRDIDDPASVERVDPANLATSFGPGYGLRRIIVEITNERVSRGIENRLDWWHLYRKERLRLNGKKGAISTDEIADNLGTGSFRTGGP